MSKSVILKCRLLAVVFIFFSMTPVLWTPAKVSAFTDISNMSDQTFFGVWSGSQWTTAGKLNYSYSPGLTVVENYVKQGNYAGAKAELLNYYKNRTSRTVYPFEAGERNTNNTTLAINDIFSMNMGESMLGTVTVNNSFNTVSLDITSTINSNLEKDLTKSTFMLMAAKVEGSGSEFCSREHATTSYRPELEAYVGGQLYTITAEADNYIRPGTYGNNNYGTNTTLPVKEDGAPYTDYTRRAYFRFDLSSLPGTASSVTLKLTGRNTSDTGNKDIYIFSVADTSWRETVQTWNSTKGETFSWYGTSYSTNWNKPATGADAQWQNIVTRLNFVKQLAQEYTITSDSTYANHAIRILLDFIDDNDTRIIYNNSLDSGLRAFNIVRAYHYVRGSSPMDSSANTSILKYMWQLANELNKPENYTSTNNWGVSETAGLYHIAVYFPEFIDASTWKITADSRLESLMTNLNYSDGSYSEASSMYTGVTIGGFLDVKNMAYVNSLTLPSAFDSGLEQMGIYLMDSYLPNKMDPQYGDSDYINNSYRFGKLADYYNNDNLRYYSTFGAQGTPPTYTSKGYTTGAKIAVMRTGWDDNALYLHINEGVGSHRHPDNNHIIAYGYGNRLLVDPGRYTYNSDTVATWLRWRTISHNTVTINNSYQDINIAGTIDGWESNGFFDHFRGKDSSTTSTNHYRNVLFIKDPGFWIVSDLITGMITKLEQTWHSLPGAGLTLDGTTKRAKSNFSGTGNIQIVPADPNTFTATLPDGYYSANYGGVTNAKYVSYVKNVSSDDTFDTILYPTSATDTNRDVRVTRLTLSDGAPKTTATSFKVDMNYGSGDKGYYYYAYGTAPTAQRGFDIFTYNGRMAYVQTNNGGTLKSAVIMDGSNFIQNATTLINFSQKIPNIGVKWNGTKVEIFGSGLGEDTGISTAIAIYAPSATKVKLNNNNISFVKSGNYIYAVKPL